MWVRRRPGGVAGARRGAVHDHDADSGSPSQAMISIVYCLGARPLGVESPGITATSGMCVVTAQYRHRDGESSVTDSESRSG